jgi:hypothetical protein
MERDHFHHEIQIAALRLSDFIQRKSEKMRRRAARRGETRRTEGTSAIKNSDPDCLLQIAVVPQKA